MSLRQRSEALVDVHHQPPSPYPPRGVWAFIWYFLGQYRGLILTFYVVSILSASLGAIGPYLLRHIIDTLLTYPVPAQAWPHLTPLLYAYLGLSLLGNISVYAVVSWMRATMLNSGITHVVRRQLHSYLLQHSWGFFQNDFAGRLTNKIMETGSEIRNLVNQGRRAVVACTWFGVAAITLFLTQPWLVVPFALWAAVFLYAIFTRVPPIRRLSALFSDSRSVAVGHMVDSYSNIQTVKLFAGQQREDSGVTADLHHARRLHADTAFANFKLDTFTASLEAMLTGGLLVTALLLWNAGLTTPGTLAMVVPLSLLLINQASQLREELSTAIESLGTIQDGMETLVHPITLQDAPGAKPLNLTKGEIKFTNATFSYHPSLPPVLENLSLTIPAGQRVGLIGTSGAGKSTLVNLLLRFFDLTEGTISIDGQNIANVTQESLRAHIGMVTQDTSLLHRSLRNNITYGKPDATDEELIHAAKLAHAHSFIQSLVDKDNRTGYNAHVGERGVKLSGGQRQRIAIARLILKNAPILILDEATSALDSEVEHAIQENLATLMSGKTVIAIAHRLSTIAALDRLLVMENGTIVEDGTHAELLKANGPYAKLWARQSGGFLPE
ncbi:MAG: ATP-binding cassette domain-containing protein [Proteobacteria bacterium]|nr:ATP-binding cassette domain-containing protein [Pseudomonadota bacterium]